MNFEKLVMSLVYLCKFLLNQQKIQFSVYPALKQKNYNVKTVIGFKRYYKCPCKVASFCICIPMCTIIYMEFYKAKNLKKK